ncbi:metal-dependent hydrolase [Candidatus Woesearchaeota archaeon]|nr:metal-dependent hydrolase [Candidatus Woesearchaeota archaeon]MBI2130423.1 metal-dependent hydrolase [Candidatus Woesearchaeota archaeon]MBI2660753.1 metal-dependent hydrolase [Candidatus Woesearchaeota archaeon]
MPQAVVHVLFALIALDLVRDYIIKDKKKVPLHYVFIGGIAGLLPDIDIPLFWVISNFLGFDVPMFHRTFTHTVFFAILFLIPSLLFYSTNKKISMLFAIISFGVGFHVFLDFLLSGTIAPLYPFSSIQVGLNIFGRTGLQYFAEGIEAVVLLAWLWHEEMRHRISDFI